ncbi:unnamed protein product [Rotaria magnacalcarata]|uniref:Pentapeptide repeat-containing protein n=1 Tax=Rotaria magnacalcarata TaxID=392030 RepID=A0A815UPR4_9BILA|nr:unnamed protein product [Rotaria magnacalcarata]
MDSQEQNEKLGQSLAGTRKSNDLKLKGGLKFISALFLPLALGVFTVVITLQQQSAAKQQRDEDRTAAEQQRAEDRNASRLQRFEDRNASQEQRQLERDLDDQRYKNGMFDTYIKEMGKLLQENNGSLTFNRVTATLARVKTLNIFRQLDGQRNIRVIRFLYEAEQLTETQENRSLDLSTAKLLDIDFHNTAVDEKSWDQLSLSGTLLSNVTFVGINMKHVDFSQVQFNMTSFSLAKFCDANFSLSKFNIANFTSANLANTTFVQAHFKNIDFSTTQLENVNFSLAVFEDVRFLSNSTRRTNFECSRLSNVSFSNASFSNANFSHTKFINTSFSFAVLNNVDFSFADLSYVNFSYAQLDKVNFASANLASAYFNNATAYWSNFKQVTCVGARFDDTNLSGSTFWHANAKRTSFKRVDLTKVEFTGANLYKADFNGTNITDGQLQSALSIHDALLQDGTLAQDRNLIDNGQADCNISLIDSWTLECGNVTTIESDANHTNCLFALQSILIGATMWQRINLSDKWDSSSWPYSEALLTANMSSGVSIDLRGIKNDSSISANQKLSKFQYDGSNYNTYYVYRLE